MSEYIVIPPQTKYVVYWNQPVGQSDGLLGGQAVGLSAKSCPDNSSNSFSPIRLILGRSVH